MSLSHSAVTAQFYEQVNNININCQHKIQRGTNNVFIFALQAETDPEESKLTRLASSQFQLNLHLKLASFSPFLMSFQIFKSEVIFLQDSSTGSSSLQGTRKVCVKTLLSSGICVMK